MEVKNDIYAFRDQRDAAFVDEGRSPLTAAQRSRFTGLEYYRIDARYTVRASITVFEQRRLVTLETSRGNTKHFYRYGWAKTEINGKRECLTLYQPYEDPQTQQFFAPFLDSTNGQQTYHHGRYLDLFVDPDGMITLDFNLAYNPNCAYNGRWDCVIAPIENTIEQPVKAGERLYPDYEP